MNQATLPFGLDLVRTPQARHDDPSTSKAAAKRAKKSQHAHCREILRVLGSAAAPLNAHEIAALTSVVERGIAGIDRDESGLPCRLYLGVRSVALSQVQVLRRMKEMERVGLVVVDGATSEGRRYRLAEGATW
jgi:hypothetical protein